MKSQPKRIKKEKRGVQGGEEKTAEKE